MQRAEPDGMMLGRAAARAVLMFLLVGAAFSLTLSGCGFHLRGNSAATLPPELSVMRVTMGGSGYPPLLVEMRKALLALGTVQLTDNVTARTPVLQLLGETIQNQELAIDSSGRPIAYLLNYRANFSLTGADGKPLLPAQSVKLQREYSFDRLNVIASEKQSDFIQAEMRRDAAQQIVRRLASLNTAGATNSDATQP
jgi:LPS-assembly lipoprotein